jgi:hypothetical protein
MDVPSHVRDITWSHVVLVDCFTMRVLLCILLIGVGSLTSCHSVTGR